jgi:activator of HSP90 ATPase
MSDTPTASDIRTLRFAITYGSQYSGPLRTVMLSGRVGVSPGALMETLLDSKRHSELVHQPVELGNTVGAEVHLGPNQGHGYLMEYIEGSHVTFALHPESFPDGHYATVTVMAKATDGGPTSVTLYQQSVPAANVDEVKATWDADYMKPITEAFPA